MIVGDPPPRSCRASWHWSYHDQGRGAADDHAAKQAVEDWLAAHPLDSGRKLWNVAVPVIAILGAPTSAEAQSRLAMALTAAGFDVYEPGTDMIRLTPFESEDGTEESDPPPPG